MGIKTCKKGKLSISNHPTSKRSKILKNFFRRILSFIASATQRLEDDRAFRLLHQKIPQIFMHSLVSVVKILKKVRSDRKNLGESGGLSFKGSDRGKCQY